MKDSNLGETLGLGHFVTSLRTPSYMNFHNCTILTRFQGLGVSIYKPSLPDRIYLQLFARIQFLLLGSAIV